MDIPEISSSLPFILLVFILHLLILSCQVLACNPNDLMALKGLAGCLESDIGGWNVTDSDCCSWTGVTCANSTSSSLKVVRLELGSNRLYGTVCESLLGLDELKILNLSNNFLRGSPTRFFQFQKLEILDLSRNDFAGSLSASIWLPSITYFNISDNHFSGFLNFSLCDISTNIQVLDVSNNNFTGEASTFFQNCTSLQNVSFNGNSLSGVLPANLLRLQNLQRLHLQENQFSGQLDDRIGNLSNLVELDVSNNNLSGNLPDVFGILGKLEYFTATSNKFSGNLPNSLVNSPSLVKVVLSRNLLSGPINFNCSAMVRLSTLDLGSNDFSGPLPDSLSSCKTLTAFNLARNKIGGEIPNSFGNLQALKSLSLSNTSISNISSALQILQNCKNLTMLILGKNFDHEEMPNDVDLQFKSLKALVIPNCRLRGSLPIWLRGSTMLQLVDLSGNSLSGSVPSWLLGDFMFLFYLDLSNNSFTEEIPESLTKLQSLIYNNIVSVERFSSDFPLFKGRQNATGLQYNAIDRLPPTLDLSRNKLFGLIWPRFGDLKQLHVLDLCHNQLTGAIPSNLSGMKSLETLDLAYNKLSGEIPHSLVQLSFLSKFSVAFNQLYGEIPTRGQFMTFPDSSFEGNSGLCGTNFKPCNVERTSPPPLPCSTGDDQMEIFGLNFAIGVVSGFLASAKYCFTCPFKFCRRYRSRIVGFHSDAR